MTEPVRCPLCGHCIGLVGADRVVVRHRRREVIVYAGVLRCDELRCDGQVVVRDGRPVTELRRVG